MTRAAPARPLDVEEQLREERRARQLRAIPGLVEPADYLCDACCDEGVADMGAIAIVGGAPLCRYHATEAGWVAPLRLQWEAAE